MYHLQWSNLYFFDFNIITRNSIGCFLYLLQYFWDHDCVHTMHYLLINYLGYITRHPLIDIQLSHILLDCINSSYFQVIHTYAPFSPRPLFVSPYISCAKYLTSAYFLHMSNILSVIRPSLNLIIGTDKYSNIPITSRFYLLLVKIWHSSPVVFLTDDSNLLSFNNNIKGLMRHRLPSTNQQQILCSKNNSLIIIFLYLTIPSDNSCRIFYSSRPRSRSHHNFFLQLSI